MDSKKRTIVLLGGCGFIGRNLAVALKEAGWSVTVTSRSSEKAMRVAAEIGVHGSSFNLATDFDDERFFGQFEYVVYLIGDLLPGTSNITVAKDLSTVVPFCGLAECCAAVGISKFLLISSGGTVYGCGSPPFAEGDITNPITTYGLNKLIQEKALAIIGLSYGLNYTVVRLSNPYGPFQDSTKGQGVIAAFIKNALLQQPLMIYGDGNVTRDFIYIDDACDGIIRAIEYDGEEPIINIGSGIGLSISEVAMLVGECLEGNVQIQRISGRSVDVPSNYLDISLAKRELDFECSVDIEQGIRKTVQHEKGRMPWKNQSE